MKKLSLFALLVTLALIGLLPEQGGRIRTAGLPNFVTEAVSADGDLAYGVPGHPEGVMPGDLEAGEKLLDETCSTCHSSRLVLKSKTLAGEVDSLVQVMMIKDRKQLPEHHLRQLSAYLQSRFPRN